MCEGLGSHQTHQGDRTRGSASLFRNNLCFWFLFSRRRVTSAVAPDDSRYIFKQTLGSHQDVKTHLMRICGLKITRLHNCCVSPVRVNTVCGVSSFFVKKKEKKPTSPACTVTLLSHRLIHWLFPASSLPP